MRIVSRPIVWEKPFGGEPLPYVTVEVAGDHLNVWFDVTDTGIVFRGIEGANLTTTHLRADFGSLRTELQTTLLENLLEDAQSLAKLAPVS